MKTEPTELTVLDEQKPAPTPASSVLMKPAEFKKALEIQRKNREIIKEFVASQLIKDTDYGSIKMNKKRADGTWYEVESKPVLFKPGQEKIFSLFQITDELTRDDETLSMFGNKTGLVAYKCTLYRNGIRIGEGRGAADIGEKNGWTVNNCIKIAEKRARMDACLSLGFSEYFTQDLEDTPPAGAAPAASKARTYGQPDGDASTVQTGPVTKVVEIKEKKMLTAKNGSLRAELTTSTGKTITAFKNTYYRIHEGGKYRLELEPKEYRGNVEYVVAEVVETILEPAGLPSDEATTQTDEITLESIEQLTTNI